MDVLTISKPECAESFSHYSECSCEYCGHEIRFLAGAGGQQAECPHCARTIRLGNTAVQQVLEMHVVSGERLHKEQRSTVRRIALVVGGPLFFSGILILLGLMVTPFRVDETLSRAIALAVTLSAIGFGLVCMIEGRRITSYYVCSICASRLPTRNTLACSCCKTELR